MTCIVATYRYKSPPRKWKAGRARDASREVEAFLARMTQTGGL
jgi:hypothetical protein